MKKLAIGGLLLVALASCKQPGKGSYFAHPGPTGPTHPVPMKPAVVEAPSNNDAAWLKQCRGPIETAKTQIGQILAVQGVRNVVNTLEVYNQLSIQLNNAAYWAHLATDVNPDPKIREAGRVCEQDVTKFVANLLLDNRVYTAIKSVDISLADANTKRFVTQTLRDFKRAGVELDDSGRNRMKQIEDELTKLGQEFSKNIDEDVRKIDVKDPAQLAGLPAEWIAAHKPDPSGVIHVTTDYPDYIPFMMYADSDDLRKQLYIAFRTRGAEKNEELMQKILVLRAEKSTLLGFKDWADYQSDDKMLKGGKAAQEFLDKVNGVAMKRVKKDYAELLAQLKKTVPAATQVDDWQRMYLENQLRKDKYAVDSTEVRKYFPYEQTLKGLLDITSAIYGISYVAVEKDPRVWAPDVAVYDVMQNGTKLGRIFLDMHPRDGKFKHAQMSPLVDGVKGVQLPEAVLECNLPDPVTTKPALMEHGDVVTMFHEFGHLMHHILGGQQHWVRQSGVATEWDFVEAPSQMFEEWAWNYDVLARFAKHVDTGAVIPKDLVDKMRKADRFGKGLWATQQLFYAALSLKFHQESPGKLNQLDMVKALQKKYTPFAYVEGTKFHTSFGHLVGYSSMYYTYLWSLVIAKDLLSPFEKKGLLATDVTYAYRDKILAPGGTKDAADLVKDFLGRPYNFKAFEKYLSEQ
ncbi:MAG TPA: M3 family metallopeptidase [Kofleriaceae bacterium]|nr:M3 family metallopeptidase [Kofleriaceae bacterium]